MCFFKQPIALFTIASLFLANFSSASELESQALAFPAYFAGSRVVQIVSRRDILTVAGSLAAAWGAVAIFPKTASAQPPRATLSPAALMRLLRDRRRAAPSLDAALPDHAELRALRARADAPDILLKLFAASLDARVQRDVLHQLGQIAQLNSARVSALEPTEEQLMLLVQALAGSRTKGPAAQILTALGRQRARIQVLTAEAQAAWAAFDEPTRAPAIRSNLVLMDAVALVAGRSSERTWTSDRLLAILQAYPGTSAATKAIETIARAGAPDVNQLPKNMTPVTGRLALRALAAQIQGDSYVGGINAGYYLWPVVAAQRREFLEVLLMERMVEEKRGEQFQRVLGNLLRTFSRPTKPGDPNARSYHDDFLFLSKNASDPAVRAAARDYVFDVPLAEQRRPGSREHAKVAA